MKHFLHMLALGLLLLVTAAQSESEEKRRDIDDEALPSYYLERLSADLSIQGVAAPILTVGPFATVVKNPQLTQLYSKLKRIVSSDDSSQPRLRFKRQQSPYHPVDSQRATCADQSDCIPPEYQGRNVPASLISCDSTTGFCLCSECFIRLNDRCEVDSCKEYNFTSGCRDKRKSQKTAFLLSLFLSSVGAANFYIRQYVLGGVQLGLTVLLIVYTCACFCWFSVFADEDFGDTICFICTSICLTVLNLALLLVIPVWWVVDLMYFVFNGRQDGNQCPLIPDL